MFHQEEIFLQLQTKHLGKQHQAIMEQVKGDLLMEVLLLIDLEIIHQVLVLQIQTQIQHPLGQLHLVNPHQADNQLQPTADRRLRRPHLVDPPHQDLLVVEVFRLADRVHKFNFI